MIFYFSGTGNSQLAAKLIAEQTGDSVVSMNECLKKKAKNTYHSKEPLVFVAPTYAWRMPKVVDQWIRGNQFEGNQEAYFVLTCGEDCGNASAYAKRLCKEKGFHYRGLASVVMPENYLALFPTPSEGECRKLIEQAKPLIQEIGDQIQQGELLKEPPVGRKGKLQSGLVNVLFYPLVVHDKGFAVSAQCISCGKCVRVCPLNNVQMTNGKPVWKGSCTHCMACIAGCPVEAIVYKKASKGQYHHYMMEE